MRYSVTKSSEGVTEITGVVKNNSTLNANEVKVYMTFYNDKGNILGEFNNFVTWDAFALNQMNYIHLTFLNNLII